MELRRRDDWGPFLREADVSGACVVVGVADRAVLAPIEAAARFETVRTIDPADEPRYAPAVARTPAGSVGLVVLDLAAVPGLAAGRDALETWWSKVEPGGWFVVIERPDDAPPAADGRASLVDRFARDQGRMASFSTDDGPPVWRFLNRPREAPPAPERIALLSAHTADFAAGEASRENHAAYARRWGYQCVRRTEGFDGSRPAPWSKLSFLRQALEQADFVFWLDADAVVANPEVRLEWFWDDGVDLICGRDMNGLNTGAFFVRNTAWIHALLQRWDGLVEFTHHGWWEQAALIHLFETDPEIRRRMWVVPHRLCNSFPHLGLYSPGEFVVHFPAQPARATLIRDFLARETGAAHADQHGVCDAATSGPVFEPFRGARP